MDFKQPSGGMSVWTRFTNVNLKQVSQKACKKGLILSDGTEYNTKNKNFNAARLGFASLNFEEQERVVEILSASLNEA